MMLEKPASGDGQYVDPQREALLLQLIAQLAVHDLVLMLIAVKQERMSNTMKSGIQAVIVAVEPR